MLVVCSQCCPPLPGRTHRRQVHVRPHTMSIGIYRNFKETAQTTQFVFFVRPFFSTRTCVSTGCLSNALYYIDTLSMPTWLGSRPTVLIFTAAGMSDNALSVTVDVSLVCMQLGHDPLLSFCVWRLSLTTGFGESHVLADLTLMSFALVRLCSSVISCWKVKEEWDTNAFVHAVCVDILIQFNSIFVY
jgi:hypothetical protein